MNTLDDAGIVQHILNNRSNYYRILFLNRDATTEQIKSAYKKMALKCHPDKNKNPHADEAFKLVGTANVTLSDATKRRIYDTRGVEGVKRHESAGEANRHYPAARRHANPHADFFEEFFGRGGGMHGGARVYEAGEVNINANIFALVPLLIFFILALLLQSSLTDMSEPTSPYGHRSGVSSFSLTPEPAQGHTIERTTSMHGLRVKYYVTRNWAQQAQRNYVDVRAMEREVLQKQRESLARRCEADSLAYRARGKKETPPVCTDYEVFRKAF